MYITHLKMQNKMKLLFVNFDDIQLKLKQITHIQQFFSLKV